MKLKYLFLTLFISLVLVGSCLGSNKIIDLHLSGDLVDGKGVLTAGEIKRSSAATYINEGILYTADGDDTPFSHSSIEDETGATEMRGSFVDGQAWFHDAGGLIAVYAGTGNLLIIDDDGGTEKAYGFLGEIGTGVVAAPLANNVTAISKANPGVVSSVAHGLVVGDLVYFDSLNEMTELNTKYKAVTTVGSVDLFSINDTSGYTNAEVTGGACAHEVTEPGNTAVHIYKEHGLLNEGWNAIDTGIDYNADTAWDFDIYVNLLSSSGGTAQARFEDGRLLSEPEGTNLIPYSEDFSQWTVTRITRTTGQADPGNGSGATALASSADASDHLVRIYPVLKDDVNVTLSAFAKAGYRSWIKLQLLCKDNSAKYCYFQLSGDGATGINNSTKEAITRLGSTDWYRCSITHNIGNGSTRPRCIMFIAEDDDDIVFAGDGSTIDTYVYGADAKQNLFLTSYVPTDGIPVTRTSEAGNAADNGVRWTMGAAVMNALAEGTIAGTLIFKWTPGYAHDEDSGNYSLISCQDSYQSLVYVAGASALATYDGTTAATVNLNWTSGTTYTVALRWSDADNALQIGVQPEGGSWTWGTEQALDATGFTIGADDELKLSYSSEFPSHFNKIKFYDTAYSTADIEAGIYRRVLKWMMHFELP